MLRQALRRVSADYEVAYGRHVATVETFTDPERHRGTYYAAANFQRLGETQGYGRSAGWYHHHGKAKVCWLRELRRNARGLLSSAFEHPCIPSSRARRKAAMLDLNRVRLVGGGSLLAKLEELPDHRKARGIRHRLAAILLVASAAVLSDAGSIVTIGEWAREAPHEATVRRALQAVSVEVLDRAIGSWLEEEGRQGRIEEGQLAVAVDGKSVRGARQEDGRAVHLFAAMVHRVVVVAQREVDHKTNGITAFLVAAQGADYVLTVKDNQSGLKETLEALDEGSFPR